MYKKQKKYRLHDTFKIRKYIKKLIDFNFLNTLSEIFFNDSGRTRLLPTTLY